jgi:hypothetical protein
MTGERTRRYRKAIGTAASWAVAGVALWAGAPPWVLALVPGLSLLAAWGLPNAVTRRQRDQIVSAISARGFDPGTVAGDL